jgi:glycosyltransferase involved in cell wall biosynthesis
MNNAKKITYVFLQGRKQRITSRKKISKEFFYTYFYAAKNYTNIEIVEMENFESTISQKFLRKFDSFINKLSKLPIYTYAIFKRKNLKIFKQSDFVILSNDRVAFSSLPMIWLTKISNPNVSFSFFVMGLFSNFPKYQIQTIFRNILIKIMLKRVDKIFFLGKREYIFACKNFISYKQKFIFLPFSIDVDFWSDPSNETDAVKKDILFIGNDGNRDYKFVVKLAKDLPEYNFIFISEKINQNDNLPENVRLVNGSWGNEQLSDEEIRKYYKDVKLTIVPLKNTNQPSGQSVTLQSMAAGTPVLITRIDGFWDVDKFTDGKHITFIEKNTTSDWKVSIDKIYNDNNLYETLVTNGKLLVENEYNLKIFDTKVFKELGINE